MQWFSDCSSPEFHSVFLIQIEVERVSLTYSDAELSLLELWLVGIQPQLHLISSEGHWAFEGSEQMDALLKIPPVLTLHCICLFI